MAYRLRWTCLHQCSMTLLPMCCPGHLPLACKPSKSRCKCNNARNTARSTCNNSRTTNISNEARIKECRISTISRCLITCRSNTQDSRSIRNSISTPMPTCRRGIKLARRMPCTLNSTSSIRATRNRTTKRWVNSRNTSIKGWHNAPISKATLAQCRSNSRRCTPNSCSNKCSNNRPLRCSSSPHPLPTSNT